jgi:hypothetical protein
MILEVAEALRQEREEEAATLARIPNAKAAPGPWFSKPDRGREAGRP